MKLRATEHVDCLAAHYRCRRDLFIQPRDKLNVERLKQLLGTQQSDARSGKCRRSSMGKSVPARFADTPLADQFAEALNRITTDFDVGVRLLSAKLFTGTSTFVSGK